MDEMQTSQSFLQVIESGSFSAASEKLNVSVTTVARQISSLEDRLGVKLLNRSTRALSLTEAGVLYSERIRSLMREFDAIKREVSSYQKDVKGVLRVHLRHSVGSQVIVPALPQFLKTNPEIRLDVTLTDSLADLVTQKVDVAVWLGKLADSGLIARKLSPGRRVVCCSPAYARDCGLPTTPEELSKHNCIVYRAKNYDSVWRLKSNGEVVSVNVSGNLQSESSTVLYIAAMNGVGLAMLQEAMVHNSIASGELINVFPGYEVSSTDADVALYAVYSGRKKTPPKTEAFVDFLVRLFKNRPV
jgi:DNA-binding transcriptional LysR family regulator